MKIKYNTQEYSRETSENTWSPGRLVIVERPWIFKLQVWFDTKYAFFLHRNSIEKTRLHRERIDYLGNLERGLIKVKSLCHPVMRIMNYFV